MIKTQNESQNRPTLTLYYFYIQITYAVNGRKYTVAQYMFNKLTHTNL